MKIETTRGPFEIPDAIYNNAIELRRWMEDHYVQRLNGITITYDQSSLMPGVGLFSESYPYLALSRRRELDYGAVLRAVDWLKVAWPSRDLHLAVLNDGLSPDGHREIAEEYELELQRRRERA